MSEYGYHFIFSSCESDDEELAKLDGKSFDRLGDAVKFLLNNDGNNVCIMVWKEKFDEYGNIIDINCVDEFNSASYLNMCR